LIRLSTVAASFKEKIQEICSEWSGGAGRRVAAKCAVTKKSAGVAAGRMEAVAGCLQTSALDHGFD
jgi:hypothetical protein